MEFKFKPKPTTRLLVRTVAVLTVLHLLGVFSTFALGRDTVMGLIPLFDFEGEANVPAVYSAAAMLFCAVLLASIARNNRFQEKPAFHWGGLSFLFLFLAADELFQIHERLIGLRKTLHLSGLLYHAWVLPYLVGAGLVALWSRRFLLDLATPVRRQFLLAGAIYILGAAGFEMIGGWYRESIGWDLTAALLATVEELLEMAGIILFARALMLYLQDNFTVRQTSANVAEMPPE